MYIVSGHFQFNEDKLEKAQEYMHSIVALGRREPGVLSYSFYPDPLQSKHFFLFEEWESKEKHDAHFNSEQMKKMLPSFFELLDEKPKVTYYDAQIESTL